MMIADSIISKQIGEMRGFDPKTKTRACRKCGSTRRLVDLSFTRLGGECRVGGCSSKAAKASPSTPASSSTPVTPTLPRPEPPTFAQAADPETSFARYVLALGAGKSPNAAAEIARQQWDDVTVARALQATSAAGGGFLVPEQFAATFIEYLGAKTIVRQAITQSGLVVPLKGRSAMPKVSGEVTAAYLSEGNTIAISDPSFGQLSFTARKLVSMTPVSNDVFRYRQPANETLIREILSTAVGRAEDRGFLRGDGTAGGPLGLRYLAPSGNVIAANATINLANVSSDLKSVELRLINGNIAMVAPAWIMAPRSLAYLKGLRTTDGARAFPEIEQGRLLGYPVLSTTAVPTNLGGGSDESEIYLVDFSELAIGDASLYVNVANSGAYVDGSGNIQSAFSRDQSIVRVIMLSDIAAKHPEAVAVLTAVKWS